MTQEIQISNLNIPAPDYRISALVAQLLLGKLLPKGGEFSKEIAGEYIAALRGIPEWAIAKACEEYRFGKVGDGKFAPMPAELAKRSREHHNESVRQQARENDQKREVHNIRAFKSLFTNRTDEERQRVAAKLEETKQALAMAQLDNEAAAIESAKRRDEMIARHDERFADQYRFGGPEKWRLP